MHFFGGDFEGRALCVWWLWWWAASGEKKKRKKTSFFCQRKNTREKYL